MNPKKIILCPNPNRDLGMKTTQAADRILREMGFQTVVCSPFRDQKEELFAGYQPRPLTQELKSADLLLTLLREDNIDLTPVYSDCGSLLFGDEQDAHAGGSGCGCSAAVLCGPLLRDMQAGKIKRLVFAGTGAMMSPTSVQQGQPIAGICHAVVIERSGA